MAKAKNSSSRYSSSKKSSERPSGKFSGPSSRTGSSGGGGFTFKDRAGKVRTIGKGPGGGSTGAPSSSGGRLPTPKAPTAKTPDHADWRAYPKSRAPQPEGFESGPKHKPRGGKSFDRDESSRGSRGRREDRGARSDRGPQGRTQKGSSRNDRPGGPMPKAPRGTRRSAPKTEPTRDQDGSLRLRGVIEKNRKGFGFLVFDDSRYEDLFLPPQEVDNFFHGDRIEVSLSPRDEVLGFKVLEHRFRELFGRWSPHPSGVASRGGSVIYERKKTREDVFVPVAPEGIKAGDWVRCALIYPEGAENSGPGNLQGEIKEVYGAILPPSADLPMVSAEFNLIEAHSAAAEAEARAYKLEVDEILKDRTDLRHVPLITIDGETARDFDDAVYVERDKSGYVLWVGIADVSNYVKPDTALDEEARARGTSVYFPERAFHMLPRALSENLCSLRPHEPRLAFTAKMHIDRDGKILKTELFESLIESRRRATYNEIQAESEAHKGDLNWEFRPHFELYEILRKSRSARGSIDFDLPEAELKVAPTGEVISIQKRARQDAHRLIEEFMILANEAVTAWALERQWPFVYRVHEEPSEPSIAKFLKLAQSVGFEAKVKATDDLKATLSQWVKEMDGHPAQLTLNLALLRSMKQAVYSAAHGSHFGLASEGYTHFTSPIRRYPDLLVHRMLRQALRVEQKKLPRPSDFEMKQQNQDLEEAAEHCSHRERLAAEAERESIRLKQVRAMTTRIGEEFDGLIVSLMESGLFVQLDDPWVEGLLPADSLMDDHYRFKEDQLMFVGSRTRKTYKVGDRVRVRCVRTSLDDRQIEFGLAETASGDGITTPVPRVEPGKKFPTQRSRAGRRGR